MFYRGCGSYECVECGYVAFDAFGKVKAFLDKYGTQPMLIVSQSTGVSMEILSELLKDGRLQVPPDSNIFLKCEKCGCAIRSGRICSRCSVNTFQEIRNLLTEDTRKKANEKSDEHSEKKIRESVGKMRFVKRK